MEEVSPQIGAWLPGCQPTTQSFLCASAACDITLRPRSHVHQPPALLGASFWPRRRTPPQTRVVPATADSLRRSAHSFGPSAAPSALHDWSQQGTVSWTSMRHDITVFYYRRTSSARCQLPRAPIHRLTAAANAAFWQEHFATPATRFPSASAQEKVLGEASRR